VCVCVCVCVIRVCLIVCLFVNVFFVFPLIFFLRSALLIVSIYAHLPVFLCQWGTADAEIKVDSVGTQNNKGSLAKA